MPGSFRGQRVGACTDCRSSWAAYRRGDMDIEDIKDINEELAPTVRLSTWTTPKLKLTVYRPALAALWALRGESCHVRSFCVMLTIYQHHGLCCCGSRFDASGWSISTSRLCSSNADSRRDWGNGSISGCESILAKTTSHSFEGVLPQCHHGSASHRRLHQRSSPSHGNHQPSSRRRRPTHPQEL